MPENIAPELEEKIREFVKSKLKDADIAHGFDHIEYVANLVGIDHVGLGSDINENFRALPVKSAFETIYSSMLGPYKDTPGPAAKGFERVDDYLNVTRALVARGYSDSDILKILGGNVLRVVEEVWDRNS